MIVEQVRPGGEISLPVEIQDALGLTTGDLVSSEVTAQGTVEIRRLAPVRLADLLERYRIGGPIDEAAVRDEWQDIAAREVLGFDEHGRSVDPPSPLPDGA
jgi:bifunctional DNA-binding transcriptional regulator/antitoxin component of YhaV-PrlF toxin-antitoxin module